MDLKKIGLFLLVILLLLSIGLNLKGTQNQQKIGYVILPKIFEEFKGKKEMEVQFMSSKKQREQLLDSISMDIQSLQVRFNESPKKEAMVRELAQKQAIFSRLNNEFSQQEQQDDIEYSEKVWKQINQYTSDFGDLNGYNFIHGTSGDGTLMYGNKANNITSTLIQYINQRYEGL